MIFPYTILTISTIVFISFAHAAYLQEVKGIPFQRPTNYYQVNIPDNVDCSSIHNGEFETERVKIIRTEEKQLEISKTSGDTLELQITWINNCEYVLKPIYEDSSHILTKVIFVNYELYRCYSTLNNRIDAKPMFLTVKKIKK